MLDLSQAFGYYTRIDSTLPWEEFSDSVIAPPLTNTGFLSMKAKTYLFQPDDLVVYPAQGVGKIERVDHQEICGTCCEFFIVRILASNVTLMVPVSTAEKVGLRHLVSSDDAEKIMAFLQESSPKAVYTGQNWNRRFREYSDKLQSPDLYQVAAVLKELLTIGRIKELSFGEKRLQEQAMNLVCGELAQVLALPEDAIKEKFFSAYGQPDDAAAEA